MACHEFQHVDTSWDVPLALWAGWWFLAWFIQQFNPARAKALFQRAILLLGTKLQLAAETW